MELKKLENLEVRFITTQIEGESVLDLDVLRYTDVTYLDFSIELLNHGQGDLSLKNPVLTLFLEEVFVLDKKLEDQYIAAGGEALIGLRELSFGSEVTDEALKGRIQRSEMTLRLIGDLHSEYFFEVQGIRLKTYRLHKTFEGKVLLRNIFGGKSPEEAVDVILGLNKSGPF
jgi:hypothetical protein